MKVLIIYRSKKTRCGYSKYSHFGRLGKGKGKERSKTPAGFAEAMALQWGVNQFTEEAKKDE